MTIIEARAQELDQLTLKHGSHDEETGDMCLLEAVAWLVGEPWTDHPACVDPVIAAFGRAWNDGLPDDETRDRILKPFLLRLAGTAAGPDVQDRRAFMVADWAVRVFTPAWLRLAGLDQHADALAALGALDSVIACHAASPTIHAAGDAAGNAARAAAWAAAWTAARDAARAAARDAARDAAWDAARDAAGDAAGDALAPTVAELQASAADLFDRMIALTEAAS